MEAEDLRYKFPIQTPETQLSKNFLRGHFVPLFLKNMLALKKNMFILKIIVNFLQN